jgi:hypothetical protein
MSNPSINRWGLNTFWHNFWFNDFNYSINLRQDKAFSILVKTFIFYGLNLSYNLFSNKYWYSNLYSHLSIKDYYRWVTYTPSGKKELSENYQIRQEADCIFPMKIWILKYGHWVIINQYWFNPFKGRRKLMKIIDNPNNIDSFTTFKKPQYKNYRRIKTLFSYTYLNTLKLKYYYSF